MDKKPFSSFLKLDILRVILEEIDIPPQLWQKEAFKAVLRQYKRIPRKGSSAGN
jgi:hypothetical protein